MQIVEKKSDLAKLEVIDCGKPLDEAAWDMVCHLNSTFLLPSTSLHAFFIFLRHTFQDDVAGCFEYYAELAEALDGKQKAPVCLPMQTFRCHVSKEPVGVVGLITPWYVDV